MNSADLSRIEHEFARTRRHLLRMTLHRRLPSGPNTAFSRDPERIDGVWGSLCGTADPGTSRFRVLMTGEPFEIDSHLCHVETVLPSQAGPQADVLIVREHERTSSDERLTRRALQRRDLEDLLKQGRVHVRCGRRTLASLRPDLGGVA